MRGRTKAKKPLVVSEERINQNVCLYRNSRKGYRCNWGWGPRE